MGSCLVIRFPSRPCLPCLSRRTYFVGVEETIGVVGFPFGLSHDSSEELELVISWSARVTCEEGLQSHWPHLVEQTVQGPRTHPYQSISALSSASFLLLLLLLFSALGDSAKGERGTDAWMIV